MLRVGECIAKIKNRIDPCLVKIPLIPVEKGTITDNWLKVNTPGYLPELHDGDNPRHAGYLPRHNIREENSKHPPENSAPHQRLLADILLNPFSGITQRYKRLKLNPKYGNKFKNLLISQGCIQPRKIVTTRGWITLFDLTRKGKIVLRDLGYEIKNISEGIVHRFWKHKISEYYTSKDLEVLVEKNINGRPDIIVKNHNKRIAVEIETGKSDVIANIQRALKAGFDLVICVATNRYVEEKIRQDLKNKNIDDDRVKLTSVFAFDVG
jgi:hypothetical protein